MWDTYRKHIRVKHLMTKDVVTLTQGQSLPLASSLMNMRRIRHLPVVDTEGKLVGLVTHRDVLAAQLSALSPLDDQERSSLQLSVPVASIMKTNVWTVSPEAPVENAAKMLRDHNYGCLPVTVDGLLVGIVTEADFLRYLASPSSFRMKGAPSVADCMTPCPYTISVTDTVGEARHLMERHGIRHLPVFDAEGVLAGLVSERDLGIAEAIGGGPEEAANITMGLVGSGPPYVVSMTDRLDEALFDMANAKIGSAMVSSGEELAGILTATDACRLLGEWLRAEFPKPD